MPKPVATGSAQTPAYRQAGGSYASASHCVPSQCLKEPPTALAYGELHQSYLFEPLGTESRTFHRAAAPLEGPGSNPAVEDLPQGPGGPYRRRDRRRRRCCRRHRFCSAASLGGRCGGVRFSAAFDSFVRFFDAVMLILGAFRACLAW